MTEELQLAMLGVSCWKLVRILPSPLDLHSLCASRTIQHLVCMYTAEADLLSAQTQLQL